VRELIAPEAMRRLSLIELKKTGDLKKKAKGEKEGIFPPLKRKNLERQISMSCRRLRPGTGSQNPREKRVI